MNAQIIGQMAVSGALMGLVYALIAYGFQLCTGRQPSAKETTVLLDMLKRHQPKPGEIDSHTLVARVLLNLDETITKE